MFPFRLSNLSLGNRKSGGGGSTPAVFILRDDFTTPASAPLSSPRTCEPGPSTIDIIDTTNYLSIHASSYLLMSQKKGTGDPGIWSTDQNTRAAGLAAMWEFYRDSEYRYLMFGTDTNKTGSPTMYLLLKYQDQSALVLPTESGFMIYDRTNVAKLKWEKLFFVCKSAGFYLIITENETDYILHLVNNVQSGNFYSSFSGDTVGAGSDVRVNTHRIFQLGSPWTDDYGIATQRLSGARSPGDTFSHEADCLIEATVTTVPSGDQIELRFRVQDTSNYWQVTVDSSGNLDLDEVVSGSPTQRGTSAGVIANGDRLLIICHDDEIVVYEANNKRITYTSATNFKTATAGELETEGTGGSVSDIVSYPRHITGAALTELQRFE